jgi:hypothetical protein
VPHIKRSLTPGAVRCRQVPPGPCENFLYGFKAAPRGRSRRRLGTAQPRSRFAPARLASVARSAGAKGESGAAEPEEVSEPRRI